MYCRYVAVEADDCPDVSTCDQDPTATSKRFDEDQKDEYQNTTNGEWYDGNCDMPTCPMDPNSDELDDGSHCEGDNMFFQTYSTGGPDKFQNPPGVYSDEDNCGTYDVYQKRCDSYCEYVPVTAEECPDMTGDDCSYDEVVGRGFSYTGTDNFHHPTEDQGR
eukprot:UN29494